MRQGAPTTLERSPSLDLGLSESINWVSSESWILYLVSNVDPDPVNQTVQNAAWVAISPVAVTPEGRACTKDSFQQNDSGLLCFIRCPTMRLRYSDAFRRAEADRGRPQSSPGVIADLFLLQEDSGRRRVLGAD